MNLSILAFAIFWALRQFRVDPAVATISTVVVSFGYAFVVGIGPPVWRAALMLATYLGARLLYRERDMMNAIRAAALGVLIVDPHALFGASFQLMFLAVFIIAGFIGDRLSLALPRDPDAGGNWSERIALHRGADAGGTGAAHGVPLSSRDQHGKPANLAVIPLTQVLMPAAAAGLGYISSALAKPTVWISGLALEGIAGTVHWLGGAQVAGASTFGTSIADLRVAMPSLAMLAAQIRRTRLAVFASVVFLFGVGGLDCLCPLTPHLRAGVMEMTTIDVGQGDSILLVTLEGRALLIDAGGLPQWMHSDFDLGEQVVSS
jgi:competence protein ComEC